MPGAIFAFTLQARVELGTATGQGKLGCLYALNNLRKSFRDKVLEIHQFSPWNIMFGLAAAGAEASSLMTAVTR